MGDPCEADVIRFRSNGDRLARRLSDIGRRQLPFATAKALTLTAKDGADEVKLRLAARLDRPKRFTVNAPTIIPAKKTRPVASVILKGGERSPVAKYLEPLDRGGRRRHKPFELKLISLGLMASDEYAVPGRGVRLDRYGNISRAALRKMIAGAAAGGGSAGSYFVPSVTTGAGLARGIWKRGARGVEPVLIFVKDDPTYRKVVDFDAAVIETAGLVFPRHFLATFSAAVRQSRGL